MEVRAELNSNQKIFDNEKYREVEKMLDEMDKQVETKTLKESDFPKFNDSESGQIMSNI